MADEIKSLSGSDGLVIGEVRYFGLEILFPIPKDNRGRLWVPFNSGENIIYGKNGAGKSTVISAIKSALSGLKDAALEAEIYLYIKILDNGDDYSADLEEPEAFLENEQEFIDHLENDYDMEESNDSNENFASSVNGQHISADSTSEAFPDENVQENCDAQHNDQNIAMDSYPANPSENRKSNDLLASNKPGVAESDIVQCNMFNPNSPEGWSMRPLESFSHYRSYIS